MQFDLFIFSVLITGISACKKDGNLELEQACFTKRTVASEEETLVGGGESYTAVCRKHLK